MASPVDGPLPPFRTPQAVGLKTFTPPPLDGSLILPQIFDHHRKHSAGHTFYRFEVDGRLETISWEKLVQGVHRAAKVVQEAALTAGVTAHSSNKPVFGVLAAADTVSYITTLMGVVRAGFVGFPISTRNSPAALAHLLVKTNAQFVFTTPDAPTQTLINAALESLKEPSNTESSGAFDVSILSVPQFEHLYPSEDTSFEYLPDMPNPGIDTPALILHSSGSTAFPKPIGYSHRNLLENMRHPYYGGVDLSDEILAAHGLPPFHAIGIVTTCWASSTGMQIGVFKPSFPPTIPTPQKVFDGIISSGATRAFVVPMFAEAWSKDTGAIEVLKKLRGVIYSGGPMNQEIGDFLTAQGVSLRPAYGSTETGFMNVVLTREPMGADWEYFEFSDHVKPGLLDDGSGQFELLLIPCSSHTPGVINTTYENGPAYTTNDLLVRHPTKPNLWRVYGRADDQIMLSTGEKTNPGPIESILGRDPHIQNALLFGRGRFQNGALIEPKKPFQFDPADEEKLAAFRDAIWKTVEEANAYAPTHSRLFKEMIIVADPKRPFVFTPKGTVKRKAVIQEYTEEIDAVYRAVEESSLADIRPPGVWNQAETLVFVREVVKKVLKAACDDDDDIFNQHGADSLQVTWIRNAILHALRASKLSVKAIPQNFVYNYPTIARLSKYIARAASPSSEGDNNTSELDDKIEELKKMVAKYTADFTPHKGSQANTPQGEVVFLSGTTGALGTNLLAQLLVLPEVKTVYAFNRPNKGGASIRDRHVASFKDRGVDTALVDSEKLVFVEGDAAQPELGLTTELFTQIRDSVTHIIHNAWRVDFNVSLASFEPGIKGVRTLIDMALASPRSDPPRIIFTSSVATLRNYQGTTAAPEAPIEDPALPAGAGYGESKWTAERILQIAGQKTGLRPIVVRVGQLSGGANGTWNAQEWMPSIVKSAQYVKCLPGGAGEVSWLPLHTAATAIIEMRDSSSEVLHLAHPRSVSWTEIFTPIAQALNVPLVPYSEWVARLDESLRTAKSEMEAVRENPALRLIDFFRSNNADTVPPGREAGGLPKLATDIAVQVAPSLQEQNLPQLGEKDALSWVNYWKSTGFLAA
ncbi:hypothetical protein FRC02_003563 [Tulasnella sp. 418]|nr:hypothetical protein FRC02_003563 [Tulasnella sp. 418]